MDVIGIFVGLFILLFLAAVALVIAKSTLAVVLILLVHWWPSIVGIIVGAVTWVAGFDNVGALIALTGIIAHIVWWQKRADDVLARLDREPWFRWLSKN
jgi:fatty acid desaturase